MSVQGGTANAEDPCGSDINYFDLENANYVKTAADNSTLIRDIRRHERALEGAIAVICRTLLAVERVLGVGPPEESNIRVGFDDNIITDTTAEKRQDIDEVAAGLMQLREYRAKRYREDEATARHAGDETGSRAGSGGSESVNATQGGCRGARRREERATGAPTLGVRAAAPVRAAAATRRTRSGSPDWTDGIVSGLSRAPTPSGIRSAALEGVTAVRKPGGDVATESRSLLLREGCEDIHTPPPPANEEERAAAHLP